MLCTPVILLMVKVKMKKMVIRRVVNIINNSKVLLGSMAPATTMMMLTMINNHYVEYDSWMTQQIHTVPVDEPSPTHTKSIRATRPKL